MYELPSCPDVEYPDYIIYRFTDQIYKIIFFKRKRHKLFVPDPSDWSHTGEKLDQSISRARRRILELALCNPWEWFCTFTLDPKFDRTDIVEFKRAFSQWLRDQRKTTGADLKYILIPEQHQNGSWHMHGLFFGCSSCLVSFASEVSNGLYAPQRLVDGGFYDWPAYRDKFGFCSFAPIRDHVRTAFYVTKYIGKSFDSCSQSLGSHLYLASLGLNRVSLHGEVYGPAPCLDKFLDHDYDFVKTGMTKLSDCCEWHFGMEYMDDAVPLFSDQEDVSDLDEYFEYIQQVIGGFNFEV